MLLCKICERLCRRYILFSATTSIFIRSSHLLHNDNTGKRYISLYTTASFVGERNKIFQITSNQHIIAVRLSMAHEERSRKTTTKSSQKRKYTFASMNCATRTPESGLDKIATDPTMFLTEPAIINKKIQVLESILKRVSVLHSMDDSYIRNILVQFLLQLKDEDFKCGIQDMSDISMTSSLTKLLVMTDFIFNCIAMHNSQKKTRIKLCEIAQSILTVPDNTRINNHGNNQPSDTSLIAPTTATKKTLSFLTLTLVLTSLSIQIQICDAKHTSTDLENGTNLPLNLTGSSRSAASAIFSTLCSATEKDASLMCNNKNENQTYFLQLITAIMMEHQQQSVERNLATLIDQQNIVLTTIDLRILTGMARSLQINNCSLSDELNLAVTRIISSHVQAVQNDDIQHDVNKGFENQNMNDICDIQSIDVASILAFASQFRPWNTIDPVQMIHIAMDNHLWQSAENICTSIATMDKATLQNSNLGIDTVCTYIDIVLVRRAHRQADRVATMFFDLLGGDVNGRDLLERYFLNARYLHACNTIIKVIRKGALPVIERQVERIDHSVSQIKDHTSNIKTSIIEEPFYEGGTSLERASKDIRNHALLKLDESGNADTAVRLATIWNMDYVFDPNAARLAELNRKKMYIQWEDYFPSQDVPDLISTPEQLSEAAISFCLSNSIATPVYGFDVEWGYDDDTGRVGASILQIATLNKVMLIDISALSETLEGAIALERYVRPMFFTDGNNPREAVMVGFSCREDIDKLRRSPCVRKDRHWFQFNPKDSAVVDLQNIIARLSISELPKDHFGLSKTCEYFLSKPLDKSEQCSEWNQRPLSMKQRIYASLDAYVCALIYSKYIAKSRDGISSVL